MIVITGFEPLDILEGVLMTVRQLETGAAEAANEYPHVVRREGNQVAQDLVGDICSSKSEVQWNLLHVALGAEDVT